MYGRELPNEERRVTWREGFEAFVARKQTAAVAARLPGYLTVETHGHHIGLDTLGNDWTSALFDGPFFESTSRDSALPAISTVFVQSADGNTGARTPSELGGGETDTHLIYEGLSRVRADGVMAGATTIRGSQTILAVWHPELVRLRQSLGFPRYPAQIVATRRGQLGIESELMFNVPEVPVFILTTAAGARAVRPQVERRPWITIIAGHLLEGLKMLHSEHGIRRISSIGGRGLATELIDAGVVQDIYLTTSPTPGGEPRTPFYTGARPLRTTCVVRKAGRDEETGVLFEHLRTI
jgi:riboflavin biosynthesis pyrimidine reductase